MVPPRLTLVSDNTRDREAVEFTAADADARAGESAPAPSYSDPEAAVALPDDRARREKVRRLEALLFASSTPLDAAALGRYLDPGDDVEALLTELAAEFSERGVRLAKVAGKWQFRTADDLSFLLERQQKEERKLSKAALETMAIIAYHQPVTRAEIEDIRGVQTSPGTLDVLMETGWIKPRGRRRAPGRPLTYGTTETFLTHFGLDAIRDLPGLADLKAAGLLDSNLPPGFTMPEPIDVAALMPDELPLTAEGEDDELEADEEPLLQDEDDAAKADGEPGAES
ncbi:MAG: SMC-Scp complex subunit ScpB [Hyphomicrobium sp.]